MIVANLTSSPFFGGPEQVMLGLARHLPDRWQSVFLLFDERGAQRAFRDQLRAHGFEAIELVWNWPHARALVRELAGRLTGLGVDVLCCHGYKADLLGLWAARRVGIPVIAFAHGWTGHTWRVRVYERADHWALRRLDRVVCVADAQADKVRRAGVRPERITAIRNGVRMERFDRLDPAGRRDLEGLFPRPFARLVGAAGRLSPEKGFDQLVTAAALVAQARPEAGFLVFGDGPSRPALTRQVAALGLEGRVVFAGHRTDLDRLLPHLDVLAIPSFTEGLPSVLLEAFAAGVPVVATAVGGIPEAVAEGLNGYLVPPGDPPALARQLALILADDAHRRAMGRHGREMVRTGFSFTAQADRYRALLDGLAGGPAPPGPQALRSGEAAPTGPGTHQ